MKKTVYAKMDIESFCELRYCAFKLYCNALYKAKTYLESYRKYKCKEYREMIADAMEEYHYYKRLYNKRVNLD